METQPTFSGGDGAAGFTPQPGSPVDVGTALLALLEEQRKQTAILERHTALLHRVVLGDVDQLDAADVMAALKLGRTKLGEMVDDGEIPMYRASAGGPRRISRDMLRAVVRRWAERR